MTKLSVLPWLQFDFHIVQPEYERSHAWLILVKLISSLKYVCVTRYCRRVTVPNSTRPLALQTVAPVPGF